MSNLRSLLLLLCSLAAFSSSFIQLQAQNAFELRWTASSIQYHAFLVMDQQGQRGVMRVAFFNPSIGKQDMVEQTMVLENTAYGLRLTGYRPVIPGTRITKRGYITDKFYTSIDTYGNWHIVNADGYQISSASIRRVASGRDYNRLVYQFNWQ